MTWVTELAREISGQVLTDEASRQAVATDFGRLVVRKPQAVVRPASNVDVSRLLKFAAKHQLTVPTRRPGHFQAGPSLSDPVDLDATSLGQHKRVGDQPM